MLSLNLSLKNTVEGIKICWNEYKGEFDSYLLLRKQFEYPNSSVDGFIVYKGKDNVCVDKDIVSGKIYYYKVYVVVNGGRYDNDYLFDTRSMNSIMATCEDNFTKDYLYDKLPSIYRNKDYELNENLPLYRFLIASGYELSKLNTFIEYMISNIDVDTCDEKYLPLLSKFFGVEYDNSLTINENRHIIKITIESLLYKGTLHGLEFMLQSLTKSNVNVGVNKDKVRLDGNIEAINERRKVTINMETKEDDYSWVNTRKDKIQKIINDYIRLDYNFELFVSFYYDEIYDKNILEIPEGDYATTTYTDNLDFEKYVTLRAEMLGRVEYLRGYGNGFSDLHQIEGKTESLYDLIHNLYNEVANLIVVEVNSEILRTSYKEVANLNMIENSRELITNTSSDKKDMSSSLDGVFNNIIKDSHSLKYDTVKVSKEGFEQKITNEYSLENYKMTNLDDGLISKIMLTCVELCGIIIGDNLSSIEVVESLREDAYIIDYSLPENCLREPLNLRGVSMFRGRLSNYDTIRINGEETLIIL